MSDEEHDPSPKQMPISDLRMEPGSEDLMESPAMEPYMRMVMAMMQGKDLSNAVGEIAQLPLEQRYVWRVASALKWAFADFDSVNVEADRQTLSDGDRRQLFDLLQHRPLQLCLFFSALLGQKEMEGLMVSAIKNSRLVNGHSAER